MNLKRNIHVVSYFSCCMVYSFLCYGFESELIYVIVAMAYAAIAWTEYRG